MLTSLWWRSTNCIDSLGLLCPICCVECPEQSDSDQSLNHSIFANHIPKQSTHSRNSISRNFQTANDECKLSRGSTRPGFCPSGLVIVRRIRSGQAETDRAPLFVLPLQEESSSFHRNSPRASLLRDERKDDERTQRGKVTDSPLRAEQRHSNVLLFVRLICTTFFYPLNRCLFYRFTKIMSAMRLWKEAYQSKNPPLESHTIIPCFSWQASLLWEINWTWASNQLGELLV